MSHLCAVVLMFCCAMPLVAPMAAAASESWWPLLLLPAGWVVGKLIVRYGPDDLHRFVDFDAE